MSAMRVLSVSALLLGLVVAARAASPATADERQPATQAGRADAGSAALAPRAPLTAEERALLDVQDEARQSVEAVTHSMRGLPDGPALRALQLKVVQVKRDAEIKFLHVKAQFARSRGDLAAAREAEDRAEAILHPRPTVPVRLDRPVPEKVVGPNR